MCKWAYQQFWKPSQTNLILFICKDHSRRVKRCTWHSLWIFGISGHHKLVQIILTFCNPIPIVIMILREITPVNLYFLFKQCVTLRAHLHIARNLPTKSNEYSTEDFSSQAKFFFAETSPMKKLQFNFNNFFCESMSTSLKNYRKKWVSQKKLKLN